MRNFLITGGAGFIGANLVHYVLENTADSVTVLDKRSFAGKSASLLGLPEDRFEFVQGTSLGSRWWTARWPTATWWCTTPIQPVQPVLLREGRFGPAGPCLGAFLRLQATISNCSNNYGPYQHVEKFSPRHNTDVIDGIRPKLYGKGENVRDWIHANDHSSAVLAIISKARIGET